MINLIIKLILSAVSVFALSKALPRVGVNIEVVTPKALILFTVILSILNVTLKPILKLLTLPITCLTLGLFLLVINVIVVKVADYFVADFTINGWMSAFIFSICMSIVTSVIEYILKDDSSND
jgi:putative membrane protein